MVKFSGEAYQEDVTIEGLDGGAGAESVGATAEEEAQESSSADDAAKDKEKETIQVRAGRMRN